MVGYGGAVIAVLADAIEIGVICGIIGAGIAEIPLTILVVIKLIGIGDLGTVVTRISQQIAIAIILTWIGNFRAIILCRRDLIAIEIRFRLGALPLVHQAKH
jgi:hypothetical protein